MLRFNVDSVKRSDQCFMVSYSNGSGTHFVRPGDISSGQVELVELCGLEGRYIKRQLGVLPTVLGLDSETIAMLREFDLS
ncbi:hypothetical protein KKF61_04660 [Patescibacteria group bacterium]|nr:hypothetical protein [Patescibacteria group bacterium]MBU0964169.1 hypothetical protein [Patescibacteria group bacterium]